MLTANINKTISVKFCLGIFLILTVFGLVNPAAVSAAYGINRTINFQGKLVDASGVNVPNSTPVTATFSVYESNTSCPGGGTAVWSENQTFTPVDGIFRVALGSVTPFSTNINFSQDTLYLGIKVSTESNEMCMGSSRIQLAAVPQAFNAEQFAGLTADNAQTNYFTITGGQGTPATLKVDGSITVGPIISPTSSGGLTVQSNGANTLTLNSGDDITLTPTDDFNLNGTAGSLINIGTTAVTQTITLGAATNTDLALTDTNWSVTGAGAAIFTSVSSASGSNLNIDEAAAGTAAINIGTTNATSVVIGRSGQTTQIKSGTPATNGIAYSSDADGTIAFTGTGGVGTLCLQSTNGGTPVYGACTVSISDWDLITNPQDDLSLSMGNWHTAFTWGTGTGATNMFDLRDSNGNTGTGYVLSATTTGTSTAKPFYVAAGGNSLIDTTAAGGLTLGYATGGTIRVGQNGGTLQLDGTNFDVGTTGLVTLLGGLTPDITTQSNNNLTLTPGGTGAVRINTANTSASALDLNATGTVAGAAITLDTADGGITLTAAGSSNGDITLSPTDDFNLNGTAGSLINIGTSSVTQTITLGNATNTDMELADADWSVTSAGAATFTGLNLGTAGFDSCDLLRSDASGNVTCSTNGFNVVTHKNTNNANWTDADTTDLWATTGELSISVSAGSEVMVLSSFYTTAVDPGSQQVSLGARIDQEGAGVASDCADNNDIGYMIGTYTDNANGDPANIIGGDTTFVDTSTTAGGTFTYAVCVDAESTTIGGGAWVADAIDLTLIEVNDAGDLAEIYPTNDSSIEMAEVVSIDPMIEGGVVRTTKAYDRNLLGVVTTKPALVIGGREGRGVDGKPVALTGRVPVKVSTINGEIKAGDALTSSNIPGAAMKATKTGPILGIAMRGFSGEGTGTVLTYVKTGYFTGDNLAEIFTDPAVSDPSQVMLERMVNDIPAVDPKSENLSTVFTDRAIAGLEMITPKLTADKVFTRVISPAGGENLIFELSGGQVIFKNADADRAAIVLEASGSALFSGGITADWIKANRIEGVEILAARYSGLEQQVASLSGLIINTPTPTVLPSPTLTPVPSLDMTVLGEMVLKKGLTVSGLSEFFGDAVFENPVTFNNPPLFSKDTAGEAIIKTGSDRVEIVFDKEYSGPPIVTVNISFKPLTES